LAVCCDDWFQIGTLSSLLPAISVGRIHAGRRNLLGLIGDCFFNLTSIHHVEAMRLAGKARSRCREIIGQAEGDLCALWKMTCRWGDIDPVASSAVTAGWLQQLPERYKDCEKVYLDSNDFLLWSQVPIEVGKVVSSGSCDY